MYNVFVLGNAGPRSPMLYHLYNVFVPGNFVPGLLCFTVYTMFLFQAMQSPGFLWFIRLAVSFVMYKLSEAEIGLFWWMSIEERFCIAMHGLLRFGLFWVQKVCSLIIKMSLISLLTLVRAYLMLWIDFVYYFTMYHICLCYRTCLSFCSYVLHMWAMWKKSWAAWKIETNQTWAKLFSIWLDRPYEVCVMVFIWVIYTYNLFVPSFVQSL